MKKCQYCGMETDDSTVICPSCSGKDFFHKCDKCGTSFDGEFCPQCGLKVGTTSKKCPQCGTKYYSSACPNCGFTGAPVSKEVAVEPPENDPPKKKNTWLWVLGWIFIFPVPLTILILRNKEMNANRRIGFIALVWIIFIVLGIMIKTPDTTSEPEREIPSDEVILPSDEVILPFSAYDLEGQLYPDIVTRFQSIGLDNIELVPIEDLIIGWLTKDGEIEQVTINGDNSFYEGDNVKKDALIRISYHTFPGKETAAETAPASDSVTEEITAAVTAAATAAQIERGEATEKATEKITKSDHVYYSTNDLITAKKGNSGVFSYIKKGRNYDIYIIIDFDEKYNYYFLDRDENVSCERVKFNSGDLNTVLIITYHDGGDEWQNGLHFKYKNMPDRLILEDSDHYEYDFEPTDIEEALRILNTKTIYDY